MTINELVTYAVTTIGDKEDIEISVIDISEASVVTDYFVLVSGTSQKQTQAIAGEIKEKLAKHEVFLRQEEGYFGGARILLDYQDVVIHIFNSEDRRFYNLEHIWTNGITVDSKTFHVSEE